MTIHVEELGAGEAVVLAHSSGFSGRQWKSLATELAARGRRAIVPDLTGQGRSPPWPEPEPFSFRCDVEQVAAIARAAGGSHLVGHSYGALVALHAALAEPRAIRSLALFDPVAFGVLDPVADRDALAELHALDFTWGPHAADRDRWLRTFVDFWGGPGAWDGLREPVRAELQRVAWVVQQGVDSLMQDTTPLAAFAALRVPVTLLTGETSPLPARRVDQRLVEGIAGARLELIAGAGHFAPITDAAAVNRVVIAAIESC
jgi:pimeloyl-ACP methyl ester carboxylesterase